MGLILLALPVVVQAQDFVCSTNGGAITITGYTGSGGAVTIPSTTNGLPITKIGLNAFGGCSSLTSVTIPASVTNIGDHAFFGCSSLTTFTVAKLNSVFSSLDGVLFDKLQTYLVRYPGGKVGGYTIPNSVSRIYHDAFFGCISLTSVTIPASVTSIGAEAFSFCVSLTGITVNVSNSFYSSLDGVLFDKLQTILLQCPGGKAGSYTVPASVTNIGDAAFYSCSSLTAVTIPACVTSIEFGTFHACSSLTSVTIPAGVTRIGGSVFQSCTNLTNVTIPASVTNIGDWAFDACTNLTSVIIGNSVTSIGDWAFYSCGSLTAAYFEGNAPILGVGAFDGANTATVYYVAGTTGWPTVPGKWGGRPTAVWPGVVGGALFTCSTNGGMITITGYTGTVGAVSIPVTIEGLPVTSIGDSAFIWRSSLTSIVIPNSVTNIGDSAFRGCSGLTSVWIPSNVTNIGRWAFVDCTNLSAITVDALNPAYSSVAGVLFNKNQTELIQCPGGKYGSYVIPNSVIRVAYNSFQFCSSLTNVTIPNGVTSIGEWAFSWCGSLTRAVFMGNAPAIGSNVFANAANVTVYYSAGTTGWGATFGGRPTAVYSMGGVSVIQPWAIGTFNGYVEGGGVATMTVTAKGKVTGKITTGGCSYSFAAASYGAGSDSVNGFLIATTAKVGSVSLLLNLCIKHQAIMGKDSGNLGVVTGTLGSDKNIVMCRNVWKDTDMISIPGLVAGYYTATLPGGSSFGSGYLALTLDAKGNVKTVGKMADGTAVSLSSTLLVEGPETNLLAVIYSAPPLYKGGCLFGLASFGSNKILQGKGG